MKVDDYFLHMVADAAILGHEESKLSDVIEPDISHELWEHIRTTIGWRRDERDCECEHCEALMTTYITAWIDVQEQQDDEYEDESPHPLVMRVMGACVVNGISTKDVRPYSNAHGVTGVMVELMHDLHSEELGNHARCLEMQGLHVAAVTQEGGRSAILVLA